MEIPPCSWVFSRKMLGFSMAMLVYRRILGILGCSPPMRIARRCWWQGAPPGEQKHAAFWLPMIHHFGYLPHTLYIIYMPEIETYKYHNMSKIATLIGKCCNMYLRRRAKKNSENKTIVKTQQTYMTVQISSNPYPKSSSHTWWLIGVWSPYKLSQKGDAHKVWLDV